MSHLHRVLARSIPCALAALALQCTPSMEADPPAPEPPASTETTGKSAQAPSPAPAPAPAPKGPPRTIEPGEVVPPFKVTTEDGVVLDSAAIVGKKPFVLVFFASWCKICEQKIPIVKKVLAESGGDILTVGVALDDDGSWPKVAPYVARHGLTFKLVRGSAHPDFSIGFDPFQTVPVVEVIDRQGLIVTLQRGLKPNHEADLAEALRTVQSAGM